MKSIQYTVPTESPWNIAISENVTENEFGIATNDPTTKEMPMIIKVSGFSFVPIHNFVPNIQKNFYGGENNTDDIGKVSTFGDQRYIALSNGGENKSKGSGKKYNNYDS